MRPSKQCGKALNLCHIARRFEAGEVLTSAQIATDYGVCQRVAQRWLNDLSTYIVPLVVEDGKWRRFVA